MGGNRGEGGQSKRAVKRSRASRGDEKGKKVLPNRTPNRKRGEDSEKEGGGIRSPRKLGGSLFKTASEGQRGGRAKTLVGEGGKDTAAHEAPQT